MRRIRRDEDGFDVDAEFLAEGLGLEPARVVDGLRAGLITSRVERGEGADEGRWRLTFWHGTTRLRLVVDEATGEILQRSKIDYGEAADPRRRASRAV